MNTSVNSAAASTQPAHTPTPWIASDRRVSAHDGTQIASAMLNGSTVGNHIDTDVANAAHIVRCVNSHDELVAALAKARGALEANGWAQDCPKTMKAIRAALAAVNA